ncbi:MAG: CsgG/HfaB family protein, partial [bacterium]
MKRFAVLAVLIFIFTVEAKPKPKVAVMDIKDSSGSFPEDILSNATEMLRGKLSSTGTFIVIDRSRQKEKLQDIIKKEKKESYEQCYDSSCQIPLGQALAADRILRTSISCLGNSCMLSTEMVDLAKEAVTEGSTASFQKDLEDLSSLIKSIEEVTSDLSFKVSGNPSSFRQTVTKSKEHGAEITPEKTDPPKTAVPASPEATATASQSETQLTLETVPAGVKAIFSKGSSFEQ